MKIKINKHILLENMFASGMNTNKFFNSNTVNNVRNNANADTFFKKPAQNTATTQNTQNNVTSESVHKTASDPGKYFKEHQPTQDPGHVTSKVSIFNSKEANDEITKNNSFMHKAGELVHDHPWAAGATALGVGTLGFLGAKKAFDEKK